MKYKTITTPEGLDALPDDRAVGDSEGDLWARVPGGWNCCGVLVTSAELLYDYGPLTLLAPVEDLEPIRFEDIRVGDTVRLERALGDDHFSVTLTVRDRESDRLYASGGIYSEMLNATWYLLDRPEPEPDPRKAAIDGVLHDAQVMWSPATADLTAAILAALDEMKGEQS